MTTTLDMQVSPLDRRGTMPTPPPAFVQLAYKPRRRWVPSRFNARTVGDDGRLLLWNTFTGSVHSFGPRSRDAVLNCLDASGVQEPLGKAGDYLREKGYLVPEDANEMNKFRVFFGREQWRTDTLQLILLASEDCNFRCVYCYEKFKNGTMLPEVRQGVMKLIEQRAPRLESLRLTWFGGEPLYGWDAVSELSPFAKRIAERYGLRQEQDMTTNAYLLTEERATKLLDWGCTRFQITVDGLAEDHNCARIGRDGSPTHGVIMENLRSLQGRKDEFSVAVRVNFDQRNFARIGAFIESLSEDFGGDPRFRLRFHSVGKWGGANDENLETCGKAEVRDLVETARRTAREVGVNVHGGIREVARPGSQVCYAARPFNFIVGATGKLMKCTVALDELDANVVGQLSSDGTMQLDESRFSQWVAPHFETDSLCQSCYILPGCQGAACPLPRVQEGKRSCCSTKSELKREMRFTLDELSRTAVPA